MGKICLITSASSTDRLKTRSELIDKMRKNGALRPDTQISMKPIPKSTLTLRPYADTLYFDLLQRQYTVEAVIQAEREGYDAAVITCYFDPGVDEAREVVKFPVVGVAEASISIALLLARKKASMAVIAVAEKGVTKTFDVLDKYGFGSHLIPINPVRYIPTDVFLAAVTTRQPAAVKAAKDAYFKVARECIRDGAEIVITGCGGLGTFLEVEGVLEIDGVPILDCVTCGIKMAENLVDFWKLGISTSRRLMYRLPVEQDWKAERKNFGFD